MLSDEEINKGLEEAIERYAKKEVDRKRAVYFFTLGFSISTIIFLIIILLK